MNIGIFTDTYYPQISGVDTSVRILAEGLRDLGHNPLIFTTTDPGAKEKVEGVYRMPSVPFIFLPSRRVAFMFPPRLLLKMKSLELDLIHTQTEFTMGIFGKLTADALHIPLLHTYHTMYENYTHYMAGGRLMTPNMTRRYSRVFCNAAMAVTTPSEKTHELLKQYGVTKPIHYIPTGVNFSKFKRGLYTDAEIAAARAELGLAPGTPALINIGRVAKEKGMDMIIRAMPAILKKIPNARYVSVGDGPYVQELTTLAKSLGVEYAVKFAGPRPWPVIGKYYQAGDVFVSASTSETQGIVYIEAMAAKVPLLVKRDRVVEGILLDGKTGLFFDDERDLAELACRLLTDKDEGIRLVDAAFTHIQPLSSELFVEHMASLYKEMIDSYPKNHDRPRIKLPVRRNSTATSQNDEPTQKRHISH